MVESEKQGSTGQGGSFSLASLLSTGIGNVVILLFNVATGVILARMLGAEGRGDLYALLAYPALVVGVALGILRPVVVRLVAEAETRAPEVTLALAVAAGPPTVAVALAVTWAWGLPGVTAWGWRLDLLHVVVWAPLSILTTLAADLLLAKRSWSAFNVLRTVLYPVNLVVLGAAWGLGHTALIWALVAMWAAHVVLAVAGWIIVWRHGDFAAGWWRGGFVYLRDAWMFVPSRALAILVAMMEQVGSTHWIGSAARGNLAIAMRVVGSVMMAGQAFGAVSLADGANAKGATDEAFKARYRVLVAVLMAMGLAGMPVAWLMIPLVFGAEFTGARDAMVLMMVGGLASALGQILEQRLEGEGRPQDLIVARCVSLLVFGGAFFGASLHLPSRLLALAVASSTAHAVRFLWVLLVVRRYMALNLWQFLVIMPEDVRLVVRGIKRRLVRKRRQP